MQFQGNAAPLTQGALSQAAATLDAPLSAIWAVLTVETSGAGFLPDRRPKILFERHVFHRLTHGVHDAQAPDLSNRTAGGYGGGGASQYVRLARAMELDEKAALESTSWGLGQVMGYNAVSVGFDDVHDMVDAFTRTEDAQVRAMMAFVKNNGLAAHLAKGRWADFARGYNGPDFARNKYDEKLRHYEARFRVGAMPNLRVRWTQMALTFLHIPGVGNIDGWYGPDTQRALLAYQHAAGLDESGEPDAATVARLADELNWPLP